MVCSYLKSLKTAGCPLLLLNNIDILTESNPNKQRFKKTCQITICAFEELLTVIKK